MSFSTPSFICKWQLIKVEPIKNGPNFTVETRNKQNDTWKPISNDKLRVAERLMKLKVEDPTHISDHIISNEEYAYFDSSSFPFFFLPWRFCATAIVKNRTLCILSRCLWLLVFWKSINSNIRWLCLKLPIPSIWCYISILLYIFFRRKRIKFLKSTNHKDKRKVQLGLLNDVPSHHISFPFIDASQFFSDVFQTWG